jgi:hypothetical protein
MKGRTQTSPHAAADTLAGGRRPRKRLEESLSLPPTLDGGTLVRIPLPHLEDAVQEAWVAHLAGEDPNLAIWSYLERLRRVERRCVCFSQLDPKELAKIHSDAIE